ncbi:MAG: Sulfur carrier protein FdhD [Hydrocarboniphaga sp.]|uniref:formate dehydrogenase accessory sulfurtransferase FdhD n=1 Tax=Hydrocarboniphaga sp. TaxID=2033016 RepID=UPI00263775D9|nr:formate dehydrogenase accessory sulfurtransferase FdhD [Hydrocarboniphaga sp.]MDB5969211.1 Sulfur carrier protein FdhD [Hydrocarboniphaga sp.]
MRRIVGREVIEREDSIAEETPIALVYNGQPHAVMMATPLDLADFALGFSLSEGIIQSPAELLEVQQVALEQGVQLSLRIPPQRLERLLERPRGIEGRSGCGICGTRHIADVLRPPPHAAAGFVVDPSALRRALVQLRYQQPLNAATGAVHAAAWATPDGTLRYLREDVGRHNALDKLIGALALSGVQAAHGFAVLTSRASYEMVLKSASAGIPMVVAISAPTSLAIDLADEAGITLVGFARDERCTVYTRPARVQNAAADILRPEKFR